MIGTWPIGAGRDGWRARPAASAWTARYGLCVHAVARFATSFRDFPGSMGQRLLHRGTRRTRRSRNNSETVMAPCTFIGPCSVRMYFSSQGAARWSGPVMASQTAGCCRRHRRLVVSTQRRDSGNLLRLPLIHGGARRACPARVRNLTRWVGTEARSPAKKKCSGESGPEQ